jgi:hypothetical protein
MAEDQGEFKSSSGAAVITLCSNYHFADSLAWPAQDARQ